MNLKTKDKMKASISAPDHSNLLFILLIILLFAMLTSCSELNDDVVFFDDSGKHPEGWLEGGHQSAVIDDMYGCIKCHGSDFLGGTSGISCETCHTDAAAHPIPWEDHGTAAVNDLSACAICHGDDFTGGASGVSCYSCHEGPYGFGHPDGWETDHALEARQGTASCAKNNCHGTDYRGGASGVSCYQCHLGGPSGNPHPSNWSDPEESHQNFMESNGKDATSCAYQYCHGTDLRGGTAPPNGSWSAAPSCYSCHEKEWNTP